MRQKGFNIGDNAKKKKKNYKILIICGAVLFVLIAINILWFTGTITNIVESITACEWEETIVEPTCTEEGYTLHTCTKHGETYKDNYVSAKGHTSGVYETITEATETTAGEAAQVCPDCGLILDYKIILPIGHNFVYEFIFGNCLQGDQERYVCADCGFIYIAAQFPPTGIHNFVDGICTVCGMTEEEANAGG